jgi:hypothetical protein
LHFLGLLMLSNNRGAQGLQICVLQPLRATTACGTTRVRKGLPM